KQTRAETLADKAKGYGIPGVRVDGLDVLAVYEAAHEAVERARAGGGPSLIEAVHYRAAPHATADDPRAYIDLDRVEEVRRRECVGRFEVELRERGVLDDALVARVRSEAEEAMRTGIAEAEAEPPPDPRLVFEHAYADPPGATAGARAARSSFRSRSGCRTAAASARPSSTTIRRRRTTCTRPASRSRSRRHPAMRRACWLRRSAIRTRWSSSSRSSSTARRG